MRSAILATCCAVVALHPNWPGSKCASTAWGAEGIEADNSTIVIRSTIAFPANPSEVPDALRDAAGAQSLETLPNRIAGRIVDENLEPVARAEVILSRIAADGTRRQIAAGETNGDGRFQFDHVIDVERDFQDGIIPSQLARPDGSFELAALAPQRVSASVTFLPVALLRHGEARLIRMPISETIRGKVTDPQGHPVRDARVSVWNPVYSGQPSEVVHCGRTDADGRYVIGDVAPFSIQEHLNFEDSLRRRDPEHPEQPLATSQVFVARPLLRVDHPGFALKVTDFDNIPGEKDVQLGPPATLAGRVVFGDSGKPAAGTPVKLSSIVNERLTGREQVLSSYGALAVAGGDGKYQFENVPPGDCRVWAEPDGWVNVGESGLRITAGATTTAPDLKLTQGGSVKFHIVDDKSGEPLKLPQKATLVFAVHSADHTDNTSSQILTAVANEEGAFEFHVVPGKRALQLMGLDVDGVILQGDSVRNEVRTIEEGRVQEAVISLNAAEVQALIPEDEGAMALIERARTLITSRKYQAAIEQLKPFVKEHPQLVDSRMLLAEAYQFSGQVGEAESEYSRILEGTTPPPIAYMARNNLAFLLATATEDNLRDGARAAQLAKEALVLSGGTDANVYDTLAAAYAEANEMENAVKTMRRALELTPKDKSFREHLELYCAGRALRIERPVRNDNPEPATPAR